MKREYADEKAMCLSDLYRLYTYMHSMQQSVIMSKLTGWCDSVDHIRWVSKFAKHAVMCMYALPSP